jgi:hypothetical protein
MVSSVREKIWSVEKEKKRQRTLAREGALDAIRQRQEPKDNQPEYKEVDVRKSTSQKRKVKKPQKKRSGGVIKKFSEIARPQKFKGIF